jgi:hypothetical protein
MLTKQELYDSLVKAALDGTFPSISPFSGDCFYHLGINRCAIGFLVPDDAPFKPVETKSYLSQSEEFRAWFRNVSGLHDSQCQVLQKCHDEMAVSNDFKKKFIARLNDLEFFSEVNKYQA